jgi:hypothetical protein
VPELTTAPLDDFTQAWSFTAAATRDTAPWSDALPPLRPNVTASHPEPLAHTVATPVPEPGGAAMLLIGLALICFGVGAERGKAGSDAFAR